MPLPTQVKELQAAGYAYEDKGVCGGCGAKIEFWKTPAGNLMPFRVFEIRETESDPGSKVVRLDRITHFADCPQAKKFRNDKRKKDRV
jgi:hypothetical protein